jgi:hypothetical protein
MSTVTLIRSSSAPSHHAIVLPIDIPSVAIRCASTSGRVIRKSSARRPSYTIMPHSTCPCQSIALNMSDSLVWLRSPKIHESIQSAT